MFFGLPSTTLGSERSTVFCLNHVQGLHFGDVPGSSGRSDDPSVIADNIPSDQVQADRATQNTHPVHGVRHQQRNRPTVLVIDVFQTLKSNLGISSHNCKATKAPQPRQNNGKPPLPRLIQNGFTGEDKAGEARKTGFSRLLVHFNPGL